MTVSRHVLGRMTGGAKAAALEADTAVGSKAVGVTTALAGGAGKAKGAGAVILGCTEIGILIKQTDSLLKTVCSTQAHIDVALEYSLSDKSIEDVLGLNAEAVLKTA